MLGKINTKSAASGNQVYEHRCLFLLHFIRVRNAFFPRNTLITTYVSFLFSLSACLFVFEFFRRETMPPVSTLVTLLLIALVVERQSVRVSVSTEVSLAFFPILFAAILFGGFWAGIIGIVGLLQDLGRPYLRWISWVTTRTLVAIAAAEVAQYLRGADSSTFSSLMYTSIIAAVTYSAVDTGLATVTLFIRRPYIVLKEIRHAFLIEPLSLVVYSPLLAAIMYTYLEAPRWTLVMIIIPALAAQRLLGLYRTNREVTEKLFEAVTRLEKINVELATALVTALDARDHYTAGHSIAVATYVRDVARRIGMSKEEVKRAHICGLLHDIGKIGVPIGVLEKKSRLAKCDRLAIQRHAEVGYSILNRIEGYREIALAVRHHHERYDGGGYPDGLKGEEIPIIGRIVAVADAYSAMTSERPYRGALTREEARDRIEKEAGKQFDPEVVAAFLRVLDEAGDEYLLEAAKDIELEMSVLSATAPEPDERATEQTSLV